jgi:hypothetical protein
LINHFTFRIETFPWVMLSSLGLHFAGQVDSIDISNSGDDDDEDYGQADAKHSTTKILTSAKRDTVTRRPKEVPEQIMSTWTAASIINWILLNVARMLQWPTRVLYMVVSCLGVALLIAVLAFHVLAPLPCAVHTVIQGAFGSGDEPLNWGSQCVYFCWRMMTRSASSLSVGFFMRHADPSQPGNPWIHFQTT